MICCITDRKHSAGQSKALTTEETTKIKQVIRISDACIIGYYKPLNWLNSNRPAEVSQLV